MPIKPWRATCVQMYSDLALQAGNPAEAWAIIERNMQRALDLIEQDQSGPSPAQLYVMPEFGFQGAPQDMAVEPWIELACCPIPGPITAPFQALAQRHGIYIGGNQFETDPEWPGRYFNTSFLIAPSGEVILRYRRITTAAFPSPHDFMAAYNARYTEAERFPVVQTELGQLAMIPCSEITVPEVARIMMMQGAEVILHPTNSRDSHCEDAAKIARCDENKCYLVSANVAGPIGFSRDRQLLGGRSRIIDFEGRVQSYHEPADENVAVTALIDIEALRRNRRTDTGPSSLLRARWEMYRPWFERASFYPPNQFLERPMTSVDETAAALARARTQLTAAGFVLDGDDTEELATTSH